MKIRAILSAVFFSGLLAVSAGAAKADIVTFDDAAGQANQDTTISPLIDQGLVFDKGDGCCGVWQAEDPSQGNGTLNYIYVGPLMTITRQGGGLFDLSSVDFTLSWYTAALGLSIADPAVTIDSAHITLTGNTIGGPVVQTLTIYQGFQTYNLGLTGLSSVTITGHDDPGGGYWAMDNLQGANFGTGAVPEPATWFLMIGGFGLAGTALRRRQAVAA